MDKFAIDIEKVLDEFEFNEGREEAAATNAIKNSLCEKFSYKSISQPPYRRVGFESINLADADFGPEPATENFQPFKVPPVINTNIENKDKFNNSSDIISNDIFSIENTITCDSSELSPLINDRSESDEECIDVEIQKQENNLISDFVKRRIYVEDKPDLLDVNTLSKSQADDVEDELNERLPDITSIRSEQKCVRLNKEQQIRKSNNLPDITQEDLPPIITAKSIIKELPLLQICKPISFSTIEVSESELNDCLSNLDKSEYLDTIEECSEACEVIDEISDNNNKGLCDNKDIELVVDENLSNTENCTITSVTEELKIEHTTEESLLDNSEDKTSEEISDPASEEIQVLIDNHDDSESLAEPDEIEHLNSCDILNENIAEINEELDKTCQEALVTNIIVNSENNQEINQFYQNNWNNLLTTAKVVDKIESQEINIHVETSQSVIEENISKGDVNNLSQEQNISISTVNESNEELINERSVPQIELHQSEIEISDLSEQSFENWEDNKPSRPNTLSVIPATNIITDSEESPTPSNTSANMNPVLSLDENSLGKVPPYWVPDKEAMNCMFCNQKFTVIKRRHHCRACGLVLCSKCCNLKAPLEYMEFAEARVCQPCFNNVHRVGLEEGSSLNEPRRPNPNNPMEYCSTIPPLQQVSSNTQQPPPSVLVPTGVLKREGRSKSDTPKQVMFSDGIRPGGDLTELDGSQELPRSSSRKLPSRKIAPGNFVSKPSNMQKRLLDPQTQSFIPSNCNQLPPPVLLDCGKLIFKTDVNEVLDEPIKFAINYNLFVNVKRVKLDCCANKECWSACSDGLAYVGQDEIAIILECLPNEVLPPQDIFNLINVMFKEASKGTTVSEMSYTPTFSNNLFGNSDHGGFLFIRTTFQCCNLLLLPQYPYLIAILVHRWETPWAKLFPLRLVLRLGAEYRYYPCPIVSVRNRSPLYTEIGHTIMKILIDFRKSTYTLMSVRGLLIHMEDTQTTVLLPRNRYDQVVRALNMSNDTVLAFGSDLSLEADSHLVCVQGTKDENVYHTQAINIHSKPRKVTGASFVVFNGTLKAPGLSGKSSILEDGLMVYVTSEKMLSLRKHLRDMKDFTINCGQSDEQLVKLQWSSDDINFNIGVRSFIDNRPLDGIPSVRVHNGTDFSGQNKIIRWTEVFIIQCEEGNKAREPLDISRVSQILSRATCTALAPVLDSLAEADLCKIAVRATIHPDNVSYEAGSCGEKLPSIYMNRLDEELVPVVHEAAMSAQDTPAILELIFRIMNHA